MIKDRILTKRILSTKELYSNKTYNTQTFMELWGEPPNEIRIIRGPKCLPHWNDSDSTYDTVAPSLPSETDPQDSSD